LLLGQRSRCSGFLNSLHSWLYDNVTGNLLPPFSAIRSSYTSAMLSSSKLKKKDESWKSRNEISPVSGEIHRRLNDNPANVTSCLHTAQEIIHHCKQSWIKHWNIMWLEPLLKQILSYKPKGKRYISGVRQKWSWIWIYRCTKSLDVGDDDDDVMNYETLTEKILSMNVSHVK
jgi:hypothetical protein